MVSAFSQPKVDGDKAEIELLIGLSLKEQWVDPDLSLTNADRALTVARRIEYTEGIATAQNLKAFSYWTLGDNELAIQSALEALNIANASKLIQIQAESHYILARAYMDLSEDARSREEIARAESLAKEGGDWTQLSSIYNLKGVILFIDRKYDSALHFYKTAYDVGKSHGVAPIHFPRIISNIGECYARENPSVAFQYFNQALSLAQETGNKIAEASILGIMGRVSFEQKDLRAAESQFQSSLALAKSLGLRRVMRQVYGGLVDIRLMQGKGDQAVVYLQRYYAVRDSLLNTAKVRQIVELETQHELQLKEKNIQLLENEKRLQAIWRNLLIGLIVLIIAVSITVLQWQRYRYRRNRDMLNLEIDFLSQQHKEVVGRYKTLEAQERGGVIDSYEQKLLKQAIAVVEANISDPQMSVEKMAEVMNMSRTSLHRKIKSITGFPPSELIRSIRLRRAARLIASRADSAAQIALSVGFEDYSHFSKAFKKHFGVSPSGYEEQNYPLQVPFAVGGQN
jgi:AraC-like DNA-binding protein/Tfp pilus assembly protein PilF